MDKILTVPEVAELLQVSKTTVYQWVSQKRIPYRKIGIFVRFVEPEVLAWLDGKKVKEQG